MHYKNIFNSFLINNFVKIFPNWLNCMVKVITPFFYKIHALQKLENSGLIKIITLIK